MVKRKNKQSIIGHWSYTSGKTYVFEIEKESSGNLIYKQDLKQWGRISEPLKKKGQWYEVKAPHGMLRVKLLNDIIISQFKRIKSSKWGKHVMSKRTVCDIEGLWYSTNQDGTSIQKRLCTITKDKICFFDGPDCFYTWTDSRELTCRIDDTRYIGSVLDDEIRWSDGDIWRRKQIVDEDEKGKKKKKKKKRKKKRESVQNIHRERSYSERESLQQTEQFRAKEYPSIEHNQSNKSHEALEKKPRSYSEGDHDRMMNNKKTSLEMEIEQENIQNEQDSDVNRLLKAAFVNKQRNMFLQQNTGEDLKQPKQPLSTRRMRWDEDNLRLNEIEKTPRMKINDPDTPWNELTDEELKELVDEGAIPVDHPEIGTRRGLTAILAQIPDFTAALAKQAEQRIKEMEDEEHVHVTENEKRRREFEDKRALHYNEGYVFSTMSQNPEVIAGDIHE